MGHFRHLLLNYTPLKKVALKMIALLLVLYECAHFCDVNVIHKFKIKKRKGQVQKNS